MKSVKKFRVRKQSQQTTRAVGSDAVVIAAARWPNRKYGPLARGAGRQGAGRGALTGATRQGTTEELGRPCSLGALPAPSRTSTEPIETDQGRSGKVFADSSSQRRRRRRRRLSRNFCAECVVRKSGNAQVLAAVRDRVPLCSSTVFLFPFSNEHLQLNTTTPVFVFPSQSAPLQR